MGRTPKRTDFRWGPWFEDSRSPTPDGTRVFGNGWWTVHVRRIDGEPMTDWDEPLHLSIHDKPRSTRHDWREFQRIKNELCGPEREAVELYPRESRLLDTSNEYHLWVSAKGEDLEVGFDYGKPINEDDVRALPAEKQAEVRHGLGVPDDAPDRSKQRRRAG